MAGLAIRFRIDFGEHASLGPGKIQLLTAIRTSGSLSEAARNLGMSYRRAWLLVHDLNGCFEQPVTETILGGKGGRSVRVTAFGDMLIRNYLRLEQDIATLALKRLQRIIPTVLRRSKSCSKTSVSAKIE